MRFGVISQGQALLRSVFDQFRQGRNARLEELLALGERIGYVNTGLTEEKIMNSLKQWKYAIIASEDPPTGVEPCCICQVSFMLC
nr:unnamed protein product [Digitaria exilis]